MSGPTWWTLIAERAHGHCERCGGIGESVHHRKKRSQGGKWSYQNLVFLCGHGTSGCHGWVEHNPNDSEAEGFHVRPWQDPALIPIKSRGSYFLLLDDGEVQLV